MFDYLTEIKNKVQTYRDRLKEFYSGTNKIIENSIEEYNTLINLQYSEDIDQLGRMNNYPKIIDRTLGSVTTKPIRGGSGKMNLISILVPTENKILLDKEKMIFLEKQRVKKNNEISKINDDNFGNDDANLNLVF